MRQNTIRDDQKREKRGRVKVKVKVRENSFTFWVGICYYDTTADRMLMIDLLTSVGLTIVRMLHQQLIHHHLVVRFLFFFALLSSSSSAKTAS
jgi:hypothetical protein